MTVELAALDLGTLASFVGMRMDDLILADVHRAGFEGIRIAHGFVFQHLVEGPRTISEIGKRMDVSQQAASKAVAELVGLGFLEVSRGEDRRRSLVALSDRGRACVARARATRKRLNQRIAKRHGAEVERARALLAAILDELGGADAVRGRRVRQPK